jgi:hypothetical protein
MQPAGATAAELQRWSAARDVCGIGVASLKFGFKALGTGSDVITKAIALPGSNGSKLALMYPQGEIGNTRLDSLDADEFEYTIKAKELTAA